MSVGGLSKVIPAKQKENKKKVSQAFLPIRKVVFLKKVNTKLHVLIVLMAICAYYHLHTTKKLGPVSS